MKIRREIFETYWKLAAERQEIFFRKLKGQDGPWTTDPILRQYKFCNAYRASDRVSQYLIKEVIYKRKYPDIDTVFRIFLFRLLNRIDTWQALESKLGKISVKSFEFEKYAYALEEIKREQGKIYGNAFILCANKHFGYKEKHKNHLALLKNVFIDTKIYEDILEAKSMKDLFEILKKLPLIGNFMAYQLAVDFNYSEVFDFDENEFTCAGVGAIRGINKCFESRDGKSYEEIIMWMVENQDKELARVGLKFRDLFGRKLTAIDCQNLFCETDKYCRVAFPELRSNRTKIKVKYKQKKSPVEKPFYPPKWKINGNIEKG